MTSAGAVETIYRTESRRVLATLIRLLGSFDAAEEALHDAFTAAAAQWPRDGTPANPYAWLVSAGRFRTLDRWRRQARLTEALPGLTALLDSVQTPVQPQDILDDELRLLFTCCHPVLPPDARIALALREIGGLTTEEIARAYLTSAPTIAQRIVRAKALIRNEAIPYEVPERADLPARLESVMQVIYLIFNEGYAASNGPALTRPDLCAEAIRLARHLADLIEEPEVLGLLALMLLHEARQATRVDAEGHFVLLEDQDRSRWDRSRIAEAQGLIERAIALKRAGPYLLQAMIADLHARAVDTAHTDWNEIIALYDVLMRFAPSPVAALNRAAAVAMRDGAEAGLTAIDDVMARGGLDGYALAHAARADMLRRLGQVEAAQTSYRQALMLTLSLPERHFVETRLMQLSAQKL